MQRVYVCGSFRFVAEIERLERMLKNEGFKFQVSKTLDSRGILGCFKNIDDADIVYVVNPDGYVGRSISADIGYAYAKNKPIYVMHQIDDPPVMALINNVLSFEELINLLKSNNPFKSKNKNSR